MSRTGIRVLTILVVASAVPSLAMAQTPRSPQETPVTRFWSVLDAARSGGTGCEAVANRLEHLLQALPDPALEDFAQEWSRWWGVSYHWDLWGAAYLINGGASDDGFDYFRGWLLTQGSSRWAKVARNVDTAFDDLAPGTVAECEDIVVVLPNVYEARFKRDAPDPGAHEPQGKAWTEEELPTRFPTLARRFGPG